MLWPSWRAACSASRSPTRRPRSPDERGAGAGRPAGGAAQRGSAAASRSARWTPAAAMAASWRSTRCNSVLYDLERFGLRFVASPRHADVLLVTGPVTRNMREALERTRDCTPEPSGWSAAGDCAADGGVFKGSYAVVGGVGEPCCRWTWSSPAARRRRLNCWRGCWRCWRRRCRRSPGRPRRPEKRNRAGRTFQPARWRPEEAASLAAACREIATAERRPSEPARGHQDDREASRNASQRDM